MARTCPETARPAGPTGLGSAGAVAGLPPAGAAGEVPAAELLLRTGPGKPSGLVDRTIHLSVLKELLGQEIRGIIRAELASALALSPDGTANLSPRPSLHRAYCTPAAAAGSARALGGLGTRQDDDGWPCNTQCHSHLYEEVEISETEDEVDTENDQLVVAPPRPAPGGRPAPPTIATISADAEGSMTKLLLPAVDCEPPGSGADATPSPLQRRRSSIISDMGDTAKYLNDMSTSETVDMTQRVAEERLWSHLLAEQFPSLAICIFRVDGIIAQVGSESMEAPEPSSKLSQIADSCWFQTAGNIATILNCAFLTYMADWNFKNYSTNRVPDIAVQISHAFLGFFSLELAGRLARHRQYYFVNSTYVMNWVDFVNVASGWIDAFASMAGCHSFLRHFRTLRLLKVLRFLRLLRMFRTLQRVLDSLASTLTELIWCAVTLLLVEYMFGLMIVQSIGEFLREEGDTLMSSKDIEELRQKFGSVSSAVMSLFKVSMGAGDWYADYKILSPTGHVPQAIYLVFVVFAFLAVLNVILGVFVEKAMNNLSPTREEQAQQHAAEEMEMVNDVKALCMEGDLDADGKLCLEEWQEILSQGKIAAYMDGKGFRYHDLQLYFDICAANSNGEIDIEAFVRGCCQLKGPASCFDVKTMLVELHRVREYLEERVAVQKF